MLKKLRLRLTLICTAMTSAVFAALMLIMAASSEAQYRSANDLLFRSGVEAVMRRLQTADAIENAWLSELEISQASIIAIENNGQPLYFPGVWTPPAGRDVLVKKARDYARAAKLDYRAPPLDTANPALAEFLLDDGNGRQYRGAVAVIPAGKNWFSLTMLSDMSAENLFVRDRRFFYAALSAAVLAALALLSWWFTGKAIRPIGESMQKQRAFVAAASHELRSPLAVLKTSSAAMLADPDCAAELLPRMDRVCGRMARLVDDLLLLASADSKCRRVQPKAVSLDVVLIETAEQYWAHAGERGFSLELDLPDEILPPVRGDAEQLGQIFAILIDNAIEHAGGGKTIEVRIRRHRQRLIAEVCDHGAGIPAPLRERVFDRFFCADSSRTRHHSGLGLAIARELAAQHGGTIAAAETPGGGCTFRVILPAAEG